MKRLIQLLCPLWLAVILLSSCITQERKGCPSVRDNPIACDSSDKTNVFYDNAKTYPLQLQPVTVDGEVANPGPVDFSELPLRSVIVKETRLVAGTDSFVGAFRYDGYSLYDILNNRII